MRGICEESAASVSAGASVRLLGEHEREGRALPYSAPGFYRAAVGFRDLARYGEPQPSASLRPGGIEPIEALEDQRQHLFRDSDSRVGELKVRVASFFSHP